MSCSDIEGLSRMFSTWCCGLMYGTHSWEELPAGPSEEPLDRPEDVVDRVETVDMRRSVEDRM